MNFRNNFLENETLMTEIEVSENKTENLFLHKNRFVEIVVAQLPDLI